MCIILVRDWVYFEVDVRFFICIIKIFLVIYFCFIYSLFIFIFFCFYKIRIVYNMYIVLEESGVKNMCNGKMILNFIY